MRFDIEVQKTGAQQWSVTVTRRTPTAHVLSNRAIRRSGNHPQIFPQPPTTETDGLANTEPHYRLSTTSDTADIYQVYDNLVNKSFSRKDVVAFGRYMFAILIGDDAWQKIVNEADAASATEPIEMALSWPESEWELYRLPWEMMQNADGFLAAARRVSILRVVAGVQSPILQIALRTRVLFVVGSDLNDKDVRPGAEFIGLLRRLESLGLSFCYRIMQNATSQQIEDEIASFRPTVIHFICHGGFDNNGRAYLEVVPQKPAVKPQPLYASSLITLMEAGGAPPLIVILNACYTGQVPLTRQSPPLAVELVKGKIPMVVGMGGRVADLACRLFTRRFYEALLKGESVATAAAQGRRAGIMHLGAQAEQTIDWALPTLFLAEGLSPEVKVDQAWAARALQLEKYAGEFRTRNTPQLFADRYEVIEDYYQLVGTQRAAPANQPVKQLSVLAIEVDAWETRVKEPQYGKTRLLEEMMTRAVRDGHIPLLVTFGPNDKSPINAMELGMVLLRAIRNARRKFGLNRRPAYEFIELKRHQADPAVVLHPDVQDELDFLEPDKWGKVVRAALQLDLLALRDEARTQLSHPQLKVLVLLDEVHRFDDGAREFVYNMVGTGGLGDDNNPVPVIFTFSGVNVRPEYNTTVATLKTFLENRPLYVTHRPIGAFRPPKDEWLMYQQFLLGHEPPLIVRPDAEEDERDVYDQIYEETMGVPSQLNSNEVQAAIRMARRTRILLVADDDEILRSPA